MGSKGAACRSVWACVCILEPWILSIFVLDVSNLVLPQRSAKLVFELGADGGGVLPVDDEFEEPLDLVVRVQRCTNHLDGQRWIQKLLSK